MKGIMVVCEGEDWALLAKIKNDIVVKYIYRPDWNKKRA